MTLKDLLEQKIELYKLKDNHQIIEEEFKMRLKYLEYEMRRWTNE